MSDRPRRGRGNGRKGLAEEEEAGGKGKGKGMGRAEEEETGEIGRSRDGAEEEAGGKGMGKANVFTKGIHEEMDLVRGESLGGGGNEGGSEGGRLARSGALDEKRGHGGAGDDPPGLTLPP